MFFFKIVNLSKGVKIVSAPYGIPLAAVSDSLGRVSIVDTNRMTILRMVKGMREAQVAWLRSSDDSRNSLFLGEIIFV